MYEIAVGPLTWVGFIGLVVGLSYKLIAMYAAARRERSVLPTLDARHGLRSVGHWLLPFGARSMRLHPLMTVVSFAFHLCLLLTPLFVMGHAVLLERAWGVSWWSMPAWLADVASLAVVGGGVFFCLRRLCAPEVRNVSALSDFVIVLVVISPFVTGLLAHQQWLPYRVMVTLHVVTGVVWLVAIPFTRLSHMLWFLFSRAYMGSEFGAVRNARDW